MRVNSIRMLRVNQCLLNSTRCEFNGDLHRFIPISNEARSFEIMVTAFFHSSRPECKTESEHNTNTAGN